MPPFSKPLGFRALVIVFALTVAGTVFLSLPVSLVTARLPAFVSVAGSEGTLFSGRLFGVQAGAVRLDTVDLDFDRMPLLAGKLAGTVRFDAPDLSGTADLSSLRGSDAVIRTGSIQGFGMLTVAGQNVRYRSDVTLSTIRLEPAAGCIGGSVEMRLVADVPALVPELAVIFGDTVEMTGGGSCQNGRLNVDLRSPDGRTGITLQIEAYHVQSAQLWMKTQQQEQPDPSLGHFRRIEDRLVADIDFVR
ncbi:hypothetical protein GCM10017044_09650 [Kordiimonas sediminis]|uniref:Type II secretion system protein N n=1 Tax=Kordiimonas sediminis TaxID=1735581 RepID=A0A919AP55_9PROT|nr:type II secretion system protein N [Kordiimonas sediminis]GHF17347.1 hypothetical protein GCM10017044_09650 [Kordiimonas sediminis]